MVWWLCQWWLLGALPAFWPGAASFSKPHAHPFYVGVVEVAHNKKEATLEVSCKLFAEDAEAALEKTYKTTLDLSQPQQKARIDALLADYLQKHLTLQTDAKQQRLHYLGFEKEAESLYCYLQADDVPVVKKVYITNSLLYDFTDQQINIMHVMVDGVRKSTKLAYPDTQAALDF